MTLAGSRDRHAVPLRRLLPSLALGSAGLLCISWESLSMPGRGSLPGLCCAVGRRPRGRCTGSGTAALARLGTVSAREWSLLTGVVTGLEALVLAVPAFLPGQAGHSPGDRLACTGVVSAVALLCSIVGNALWNAASRVLPLSLVGQMIVFETVFAALYGFLWEGRWPMAMESMAMVLLLAGVVSCASVHRAQETKKEEVRGACVT